jgi:hypothetical protein
MEGTLARCNQDREGTLNDLECANARRASSAIALVIERDRRETLERESERKLNELRAELEQRRRAEREALAAAEAARQAAYEAQWREQGVTPTDVLSGTSTAVVDAPGAPDTLSAGEVPPIESEPTSVVEPAAAAQPAAQIPRPFRAPDSNVVGE